MSMSVSGLQQAAVLGGAEGDAGAATAPGLRGSRVGRSASGVGSFAAHARSSASGVGSDRLVGWRSDGRTRVV